jgi:hypothetical protein
MCVPSLVEIAPGVPELCPDIHTYTQTSIFIGIDSERTRFWVYALFLERNPLVK